MKIIFAELIGTFLLVLFGTGAIILAEESVINIGNFGIAIVFGCTVAMAIFLFGKFSGAHINPAVSMAFYIDKKISNRQFLAYVTAQLIGAIAASLVLSILYASNVNLGATLPKLNTTVVFIIEFVLTLILMLGILIIIKKQNRPLYQIALFIGFIIFLEALLAGPYTGASMNPFRSLAPAIFSNNLNTIWIYITAPILGATCAVYLNRKLLTH